jgi:hypothetical protein
VCDLWAPGLWICRAMRPEAEQQHTQLPKQHVSRSMRSAGGLGVLAFGVDCVTRSCASHNPGSWVLTLQGRGC